MYTVGLPNHHTFGGDYEFIKEIELIEDRYLKIGTKNTFLNEPFALCIDVKTKQIVGRTEYDVVNIYSINKNLKTYLEYIYVYDVFRNEVKIPQMLGEYYSNHKKYALELKKRLIAVDSEDVNTDFWHSSLQEMELGII